MMKLFMLTMQEYEIPANEILIHHNIHHATPNYIQWGSQNVRQNKHPQHNLQLILIVDYITMFHNWLKN